MTRPEPIAVIGLSTRYAGGVHNPDDLWELLISGRDPIRDFPEGRWDRGFLSSQRDAKGRSYIFAGGYLDDVAGFDADFFGISPREAQEIDPQQRLLLELAWEALEDAGVAPTALAGSPTGVFVGLSNRDYADYHGDEHINAYTNLGLSLSIASNRVSYVLDLKGPSLTVDTACSSGMVALHQAVQSLRRGECTMALAGAANLALSPKPFIGFSKASMLSPAGRCTSFDADGAGYVRAEGGGFLLLKPLADAERDGDRILGVIRETGINSDGRTMGIALPNGEAQAALLQQVYDSAGVTADQVWYVEAHGTGTAVGDPIECGALASVLGGANRGDAPLRIGSVKSNVGHLEPAAGIAGITKVLLALRYRTLPANLHFRTPNPKIDWNGWKLEVVDRHLPLPETPQPLIIGVNSFGFGGTNGHAVIEEYRPATAPAAAGTADPTGSPATPWKDVLVLSAHSATGLAELARRWVPVLAQAGHDSAAGSARRWEDLRATALHGRAALPHRLALHAGSADEALARLQDHLEGRGSLEVATGRAPAGTARLPVAWVYAGNGPQWWAMGRELMAADATYRAAVESVDALFQPMAGFSLIDELMRSEADSRMSRTEVAQPTLFALQVGLTEVLRSAGLACDAVIGHSVGEVAAAWASGALSLAQATRVIHQRSLAQSKTAGMGRMAALGIGEAQARQAIAAVAGDDGFLELAAVNSPSAVTVAGDPALLERLCEQLVAEGRFARLLALDYPFHTRAMDGIRDGLLASLQDLSPGSAQRTFVSTVEGRALSGEALGAEYWWRNVRETVAFEAGIGELLGRHGIGGFIEIGPHPVLRDYVLQTVKARSSSAPVLATLRRPRGDAVVSELGLMRQAVCAAYASGLGDPADLSPPPRQRARLPLVAWQRQPFWRGEHGLPSQRLATERDHPLLGWRVRVTGAAWTNPLEPSLLPWLADHVIQDAPVMPAAAYIEQSLAAGQRLFGDGPLLIEDLDILKPMVLATTGWPISHVRVDPADGTLAIESLAHVDAPPQDATMHVRGRVTRAEPSHRPPAAPVAEPSNTTRRLSADQHHAGASRRGMRYGPAFQGLTEVWLDDTDTLRASGWIELPDAPALTLDGYLSHPALLDACLQLLITRLVSTDPRPLACIPIRVARLAWYAPLPRRLHADVTLLRDSDRGGVADFVLRDESGAVLMRLEETRFQKVDLGVRRPVPLLADHWRASGIAQALPAIALPSPSQLLSTLSEAAADDEPVELRGEPVDRLCGLWAAQALRELQGRAGQAGSSFSLPSLQRRARVASARVPLLRELVAMATRSGHLREVLGQLQWTTEALPEVDALWSELLGQWPQSHARLMLLDQAARRLADHLCDDADADDAGVPSGSDRLPATLEAWLDGAPTAREGHGVLVRHLRALTACWPAGRAIRVVELAPGLGALTQAARAALPDERTDYVAADRDAGLLERLPTRLERPQGVRTRVLDLLDDAALARQAGSADLLLAGGGLRGTGLAPQEAVERASRLLAPGGWLMLLAVREDAGDVLLCGARHAAMADEAAWRQVFGAGTWVDTQVVPTPQGWLLMAQRAADGAGAAATDAVSPAGLAAAPASGERLRWLLLEDGRADGVPFAQAVADRLEAADQRVERMVVGADDDETTLAARLAALDPPPQRVVHLAGLTATAGDGDPMTHQALRGVPMLALARQAWVGVRVHVVTRGATAAPGGGTLDPAQSPVWGMARVMANELPGLDPRCLDLHAPLDERLATRVVEAWLETADDETEVLLDAEGRWAHRVEPVQPRLAAAPADQAVRLMAPPGGDLDALQLQAEPRRAPGRGEVELAVRAAGLNFRDVLWAMGMLPEEAVEAGFSGPTIGMECAGTVVRVGEGVDGLSVGDRVIGFATGCFASHVTTSAGAVARMPEGLSFEAAATMPTAFLTAWYALVHLARLEPGERVLIHGAAGGVGLAVVQIARLRGAIVIGTAGSTDKRRLVRLAGADHVFDSRSLAFADDVMALTDGQGVDVVLNSLAGEAITKNLQILRPFGRLLEIGKRDFYANSRIGLRPFRQNLSFFGIDADTLLVERAPLARRLFADVCEAMRAGQLKPLPYQAVPIGRAARAFRVMQQSRHVGKIVIRVPADGVDAPKVAAPAWQAQGEGTWLVTGGLGGFGLATARWLAAQGVRSLALVSRRGATTDEARQGIEALQLAGVQVRAYAADVNDEASLAAVLADIRLQAAPLRGIVHAAMVLDDAPLPLLDRGRLLQVLQPKLRGTWALHRLTREDPLEAFVLYSSAALVVGNPGQGNYVAANAYLHAFAAWRHAQGLPALSVAWGAIADVGVVTRTEGLASMIEKRSGMAPLASADALQRLGRALADDPVRLSIAPLDMRRIGEMLPAARSPRLASLAPALAAEAGTGSRETLAQRWPGTPAEQRRAVVQDVLREQLGRILGTASNQVDLERPLSDLGLDSLMAVELASALEREVGKTVSVMQMIQAGSGTAVADTLMAILEPAAHG